jgi:hypothetical protein
VAFLAGSAFTFSGDGSGDATRLTEKSGAAGWVGIQVSSSRPPSELSDADALRLKREALSVDVLNRSENLGR